MRNRLHFITDNFLLQNDFARELYHNYAKKLPVLDYHCHLSPEAIVENRKYRNCTEVWLYDDHYKWRAMRTLGINEEYITGSATDQAKFTQWSTTVPYTVRNPLYQWTHLELQRYFGIKELLSEDNAEEVYRKTSDMLQQESHHTQGLLQQMNVEVVCTTDDPTDRLASHKKAVQQKSSLQLLPTFRPDKAYATQNVRLYQKYLERLGDVSGVQISSYADLIISLERRIDYFHTHGGRLSDHGLEQLPYFDMGTYDIEHLFAKIHQGQTLSPEEQKYYTFETLVHLCKSYQKHGWVQQFHLGALRNTNERMLQKLGPDTGFDSIGDFSQARALSGFLNLLDHDDQLAKTILYNLNPSDNEVLATMIGNYNDGSIKGKMQFGSAWWFLDQKDGMEKQLNTLSNMGMLSCFVGMLTDSRSFLSFPRHEYFRRILCNLIGTDIENGELPTDIDWLGKVVSDICYYNAKTYFDF